MVWADDYDAVFAREEASRMLVVDVGEARTQFDAPLSDVVLVEAKHFLPFVCYHQMLDRIESLALHWGWELIGDLKVVSSECIQLSIGETRHKKLLISVKANAVDFAGRLRGCHEDCELLILRRRRLIETVFCDYFGLFVAVVIDVCLICCD